jgi:rRNA maturation endonuclease Nob1
MQQVNRPVCKCHNCGHIFPLDFYEGHIKICGKKAAF